MTPLERAIVATEQELGKVEMVLTDPITLRRMQAKRVVRAVLMAVLPELPRHGDEGYVYYDDLTEIIAEGE